MTDAERYTTILRKVRVDDLELWRATVRELPDLAEFGETREEALDLAFDAIESLKASSAKDGRPFPEPIEDEDEYSGRVTLRMSKSLHRAAALRADSEGVSLNSFIAECVAAGVGQSLPTQQSISWTAATGVISYEDLLTSATLEFSAASPYEAVTSFNAEPVIVRGGAGMTATEGRSARETVRLRRAP